MLTSFAAILAAAPLIASAAPLAKRVPATNIDGVVLNYALTLEHLERAFYRDGLNKYNAAAFANAGYEPWVRRRMTEIASHEKNHVAFLTAGLNEAGVTPVAECTYKFPYTDVSSFLAVSRLLEGVGVAAYLGAATSITNPEYLTAAGSILTVESRHNAWLRSAVLKGDAFPEPYDTPLDFNQVYSLASPLIVSCPSSNPALPVKAFPALTATRSGNTVKFSYSGAKSGDKLIFLSGLQTKVLPYNANGVQIPDGFYGQLYVIASSADTVADGTTLAGPAVVEYDFAPSKDVAY